MRFRKLRIAWSTWWGAIAVIIVALWLRSYRWLEVITIPLTASHSLELGTLPGMVGGSWRNVPAEWNLLQRPADEWLSSHQMPVSVAWGGMRRSQSTTAVFVPPWLLLLLSAISAMMPWRKQIGLQFSLRTLLIAMTLIAVMLGLVVYTVRS